MNNWAAMTAHSLRHHNLKKTRKTRAELKQLFQTHTKYFIFNRFQKYKVALEINVPKKSHSRLTVKGTVARDFRPLVFFTNQPHLVP
jgi:hypothetical protein